MYYVRTYVVHFHFRLHLLWLVVSGQLVQYRSRPPSAHVHAWRQVQVDRCQSVAIGARAAQQRRLVGAKTGAQQRCCLYENTSRLMFSEQPPTARPIHTTVTLVRHRHLCHLALGDVLVGREEQHHIALLVLDRHNIQQTPERRAVLLVEDHLLLQLDFAVQTNLDLRFELLLRLGAVQKTARASLLHDLGARETGELDEAIRAVDDRVAGHLGVAQHKVRVYSLCELYALIWCRGQYS